MAQSVREAQRLLNGAHQEQSAVGPVSLVASTADTHVIRRKPVSSSIVEQKKHLNVQDKSEDVQQDVLPPQSSIRNAFDQWWLEMANCLVMLGMLFAIVGTLYSHQHRTLQEWGYLVSINTLVSILATILKISALFILSSGLSQMKWYWFLNGRPIQDLCRLDQASRGAWGSLMLIAAPAGTHIITLTGAALIVLSVALDPFTQQIIRYYNCQQISLDHQATIPRSNMYYEAGLHTAAGEWPVATQLLSFIDQGLYNPLDVKTPFQCSTGNCSFAGEYSTLGFCATCEDLSSQVRITGTVRTTVGFSVLWINTTLPSTNHASFTGVNDDESEWFVMNTIPFNEAGGNEGWIEIILGAQSLPNETNYQYIAGLFQDPSGGDPTEYTCPSNVKGDSWACSNRSSSGAARCKFDPCVRTYRADVIGGQLNERLMAEHRNMYIGTDIGGGLPVWLMADLGCAGQDVRNKLKVAGFDIKNETSLVPWQVAVDTSTGTASVWAPPFPGEPQPVIPGPLLNTTNLPLDIVPAVCIYQMGYPALESITSYLPGYLSGALIPGANDDSVDGPSPVRAIFNDSYVSTDSVNFTFQAIAESITLRIRQYRYPGELPLPPQVSGTVYVDDTCVAVRWGFFAFPAAVAGITTLFLMSLMVVSGTEDRASVARNWKSDLLPLLLGGLSIEGAPLQGSSANRPVNAAKRSMRDLAKEARELTGKLNLSTATHAG